MSKVCSHCNRLCPNQPLGDLCHACSKGVVIYEAV